MNEQESTIGITLGGEKFEMTRRNSRLYTFVGQAALYNHVYLVRDDMEPNEEGAPYVTYLFEDILKRTHAETYDKITHAMGHYAFPMHLNELEPPECDIESYIKTAMQDSRDDVPEDWV